MLNMVNNNAKRGERSTMHISIQIKESNLKEVEDLFEAVLNMYIPFSFHSQVSFLFAPIELNTLKIS
jgi:hypothetical protein